VLLSQKPQVCRTLRALSKRDILGYGDRNGLRAVSDALARENVHWRICRSPIEPHIRKTKVLARTAGQQRAGRLSNGAKVVLPDNGNKDRLVYFFVLNLTLSSACCRPRSSGIYIRHARIWPKTVHDTSDTADSSVSATCILQHRSNIMRHVVPFTFIAARARFASIPQDLHVC
jgi:hypothetical protein